MAGVAGRVPLLTGAARGIGRTTAERHPPGRVFPRGVVAAAIAYLASEEASGISSEVLRVALVSAC